MILVCPACEAKFKIPDGAIPPEGRKVRCASCKHSWHAVPEQILTKPVAQQPAPRPAPPVAPSVPVEEMDAGAAARAAAVRRSVFDEPAPEPSHDEHDDADMFDEDGAPATRPADDGFDSETDDASDDFGIGAAVREQFGDEFADLDSEDSPDGEYDDGDFVARRRAEQRRQAERDHVARKRKLILFGWIALIALWLFVLFAAVFMKETVVKAVPGMTDFYEMFEGVRDVDRFRPEDGEPLSVPITEREVYVTAKLYTDKTRIETVEGRQMLMVRGFVENTGTAAGAMTAAVPQVQVDILDNRGRVLETVITDPKGFAIRRGSKLDFETSIFPIPAGVANVSVKVLEGTRSRVISNAGG
ncbi:MAG: zinc-ribbon domain-containing protein [Alphaproteobacteria bacterium]|nr:zinc-ribbon domain-containing protein [Alphaproteobacteria bacterium]